MARPLPSTNVSQFKLAISGWRWKTIGGHRHGGGCLCGVAGSFFCVCFLGSVAALLCFVPFVTFFLVAVLSLESMIASTHRFLVVWSVSTWWKHVLQCIWCCLHPCGGPWHSSSRALRPQRTPLGTNVHQPPRSVTMSSNPLLFSPHPCSPGLMQNPREA